MSIGGRIRKTIDLHTKLVTIDRTSSYTSDKPHFCLKIIDNVLRAYKLRIDNDDDDEEERYSCWCYIIIDGERFEAKIIHKGRGKFKILNDEYGGKYNNKIVDASDVVRCRIDI